MKNGFNAISVATFSQRMEQPATRTRMTSEEERKARDIRLRREEIEEDIRLCRELEGF